jgi:hypothetical protein
MVCQKISLHAQICQPLSTFAPSFIDERLPQFVPLFPKWYHIWYLSYESIS